MLFRRQTLLCALQQAGWTPTWTLTEDFALGMEMKRYGWHCRYLNEYLAVGEAPDGVRNCYQQRSRWTKARALEWSTQTIPYGGNKLHWEGISAVHSAPRRVSRLKRVYLAHGANRL